MVNKNEIQVELNKSYVPFFASVKDANESLTKTLVDTKGAEDKASTLTRDMMLSTVDIIGLNSRDKANGILPSFESCKKDFYTRIDNMECSEEVTKRLKARMSISIQAGLLVLKADTGVVIGYRLKNGYTYVSQENAVFNGKLKSNYTRDIFHNPSMVFPNQKQKGVNAIVPNINGNIWATQENIIDAFKLHFTFNSHLNDDKTGFEKNERANEEERTFAINNKSERIRTMKSLAKFYKNQHKENIAETELDEIDLFVVELQNFIKK